MTVGQYTKCIQSKDYIDHTGDPKDIGGELAKGGLEYAEAACNYLLNGRLICLGGDRCAIGHITEFFTVDSRSFPDSLDNDYCFNLLLAPHDLGQFVNGSRESNYATVVADKMQGELIKEQAHMPVPRQPVPSLFFPNKPSRYDSDFTTYPSRSYISYDPSHIPFQVPGSDQGYEVPVLHCECEGSRISYVCTVISTFWDPISKTGICGFNLLGIPIGKLICLILSYITFPLLIPALIQAWFTAKDGDPNAARLDPESGSLTLGDLIVVNGRWVYDAGHQGSNELHPVKTIQKIDSKTYEVEDFSKVENFQKFSRRWCNHTEEVPPAADPGVRPEMTPTQQTVFDNQLQPENRWYFHPFLDGCEPPEVIQ